jgi:hypothetical protein
MATMIGGDEAGLDAERRNRHMTDPITDIIGDGFHHVDDGVPQRLVTATGPDPLPQ